MTKLARTFCATGLLLGLATTSFASEGTHCQQVRLAEPGWTDLAFTGGVAQTLLEGLGYQASTDILGMTVMLESMKNRDVDVMLGYWKPAMDSYIQSYLDEGSIEAVSVNLTGAKYTYAVPRYVYEAGITDISHLAEHADKFNSRLYGLEPGSNKIILDAIAEGKYGLAGWKVIESSEQGMLAQLKRAVKREKWLAFQAWEPHPMNVKFDIAYLTGTDDTYGPNFGGAEVLSTVRKGYLAECPNVGRLVQNLKFSLDLENVGMGYILDDKQSPREAALRTLKQHPELLESWLEGVTSFDGSNGLAAVKAHFKL